MLSYSAPVSLGADELARLTRFALDVAVRAGQATLPYFRTDLEIQDKGAEGRFDPVTLADQGAERVIREAVAQAYPAHGILGEEFGHTAGNGLTWVIDPIDGTRAFMTGMLHWGLLLALFDGERPVLGVMHQPFTQELFYGTEAGSFYRHGGSERRLRCRPCGKLEDAVLTTTSPGLFAEREERPAFDRLERAVKLSKYGGIVTSMLCWPWGNWTWLRTPG